MTTTKLMTADELILLPDNGMRQELVRGELIEMPPPGKAHGVTSTRFGATLFNYADANDYGTVGDNHGYRLESNPDTVRAPDVAWFAPGHPAEQTDGYPERAPDLVVEIKSPSDSPRDVAERAQMWLDFGAQEVWYGDPQTTSVTRYRPEQEPETLSEGDILDGGDLLPGFSIPVWRLFRRHR
ncbi:MAG: Uma2 family endonuclease [Chloroflexota bacterium]|nr:Uma2 family endonuclease [Chloroflexota bacterium]MDE2684217.1 Uma2 family endonuclease [Chloroflexota bacterium]